MLVAEADVFGAGADEFVVGELFEDVGDPAGGAGDGKDGGEEVGGDVEVVVDGGGVEIDVGFEAFGASDDFFDGDGHFVPLFLVGEFAELAGHFAEVLGAGVAVFVDGVAEAHDFFFGFELVANVGVDAVGVADLVEHFHDLFVGAAVEGALEGADGGDDGGVHVSQRGGGDAGGEGGSVELVIGVEDEGLVEGADAEGIGDGAAEHVEEVAGEGEVGAWWDGVAVVADAVVGGDGGGDLALDADGFAGVGGVGHVFGFGVEGGESGDGGAEAFHGGGSAGEGFHDDDEAEGEVGLGGDGGAELFELGFRGERAVPEEVDDFFEGGVFCEFVDVDAAVGEDVVFDGGDGGGSATTSRRPAVEAGAVAWDMIYSGSQGVWICCVF